MAREKGGEAGITMQLSRRGVGIVRLGEFNAATCLAILLYLFACANRAPKELLDLSLYAPSRTTTQASGIRMIERLQATQL